MITPPLTAVTMMTERKALAAATIAGTRRKVNGVNLAPLPKLATKARKIRELEEHRETLTVK